MALGGVGTPLKISAKSCQEAFDNIEVYSTDSCEPRGARPVTVTRAFAMSRAGAKSLVFAGEDSEGEESDDDQWLDDVEDSPGPGFGAGDESDKDDATSFLDSPCGTPRASGADAVVGAGVGVTKTQFSPARGTRGGSGNGTTHNGDSSGPNGGDSIGTTNDTVAADVSPAGASEGKNETAKHYLPVDQTTRAQKRLSQKVTTANTHTRDTHVQGKELGMTFLESTQGALQETSQSVQEISNAMR